MDFLEVSKVINKSRNYTLNDSFENMLLSLNYCTQEAGSQNLRIDNPEAQLQERLVD